jgi:hypothetical protein
MNLSSLTSDSFNGGTDTSHPGMILLGIFLPSL